MPKRILLVEDDRSLAVVVVRSLENDGNEVTLATSVPAALEALSGEEFDVILTDYDLPGGTGVEVIAADVERADRGTGGDPYRILWSGVDRRREPDVRAMATPPDYVLLKSDLPEVLNLIRDLP